MPNYSDETNINILPEQWEKFDNYCVPKLREAFKNYLTQSGGPESSSNAAIQEIHVPFLSFLFGSSGECEFDLDDWKYLFKQIAVHLSVALNFEKK